jgi:hypothetical protein
MAEARLRRLCHHCMCEVPRDKWQLDPPARMGAGTCDGCGIEGKTLVQEVWLTDEEVADLILFPPGT